MNRLDLRNQVLFLVDDLMAGYFTETQVNVWLNNAQREVQKRLLKAGNNRYLKCSITTFVVNQSDYVIPEDFLKLHRLEVIVSGTPPNESSYAVGPITLNQKSMVPATTGTPQFYYMKKSRLVLSPAPDTAYTLRLWYSYRVADMTSDTDIPDVPLEYQELISLLAAEDAFIKDDRPNEKVKQKIGEYQIALDQDAQERQVDTPRSIVTTGWDDDEGFYW